MRRRLRRRASPVVDLDVTAFINLMVVLVAFFLSSVTYFQFSSLDLKIPPASSGAAELAVPLELEIIIRKDALEIGNRNRGLIRRIDNRDGRHDYQALTAALAEIKTRFPAKLDASILAESEIPYDILIKTMDAVRSYPAPGAGVKPVMVELFPEIAIGDAPRVASGAAP